MQRAQRNHRASVLLLVAAALWWHRWIPALLMAAVAAWVVFHRRLEGDLGGDLGRRWRGAWPPHTLALVPLLLAATLAYSVANEPITPKVLPIGLNVVALSIIVFGDWWLRFAHPRRVRTAAGQSRTVLSSGASPVAPGASRV